MCPQGQKEKTFEKGFMDFSVFTKLIREASSFGADVNLFMGGESLLHPQLCDMIAYCRDQGVPSRLYTNATLLDEEKSEGIIRSGLDHMTFSFDGVDKALYEETRRGARYEKTLENVRRFLAVKKSKGQRAPTVVIQCLELGRRPYSREARRKFRALFDRSMVSRVTFIAPHSFAGAYKTGQAKKKRTYSPCAFLWYSMSVMWDGSVVPCCIDLYKKHPLGSAADHSLLDLWNSEVLMKLREQIHQGRYREVDLCRECDVLWKNRFLGVPTKSVYNFVEMIRSRFRFTKPGHSKE